LWIFIPFLAIFSREKLISEFILNFEKPFAWGPPASLRVGCLLLPIGHVGRRQSASPPCPIGLLSRRVLPTPLLHAGHQSAGCLHFLLCRAPIFTTVASPEFVAARTGERSAALPAATESTLSSPALTPACGQSLLLPGTVVTGLQRLPPTRLILPSSHDIHRSPWCQLPWLANRSQSPPRHFPPLFSCRSELMLGTHRRPSATPSGTIAAVGALSRVLSLVEPSSKSPLVAASPRASLSYSVGRLGKPELHPSHRRCSWRLSAIERLHRSKSMATPRHARCDRTPSEMRGPSSRIRIG
jgi:hypothetical protein